MKKSSNRQVPGSQKAPHYTVQGGAGDGFEKWWREEDMVLRDGLLTDKPFDFEERTALFGEAIIRFAKQIPRGPHNDRLISQLVGCGTSIGANYCEANEGVSKKDFRCSIARCIKEAKETKFFLRMVVASQPSLADAARSLYREASELLRIACSMRNKSNHSD